MKVSPALITKDILLNQTYITELSISNSDFEFNVSSDAFGDKTDEALENINSFISFDQIDNLIKISIQPQITTPTGFYQFYIRIFKSSEDTTLENIFTREVISVPVLINVFESDSIKDLGVSLVDHYFKNNFFYPTKELNLSLKNASNYFLVPRGVITLQKNFGIGPETISVPFNQSSKILIAGQQRDFQLEYTFDDHFVLAQYDTRFNFVSGKDNTVVDIRTGSVFQSALSQTGIVVVIVFFIVLLIVAMIIRGRHPKLL
jgi:hypothetical protein